MASERGWWTLSTSITPSDTDLHHIAESITGGFTEGEIHGETDERGWWTLSTSVIPSDTDLEHIARLVPDGFTEGEIVRDLSARYIELMPATPTNTTVVGIDQRGLPAWIRRFARLSPEDATIPRDQRAIPAIDIVCYVDPDGDGQHIVRQISYMLWRAIDEVALDTCFYTNIETTQLPLSGPASDDPARLACSDINLEDLTWDGSPFSADAEVTPT